MWCAGFVSRSVATATYVLFVAGAAASDIYIYIDICIYIYIRLGFLTAKKHSSAFTLYCAKGVGLLIQYDIDFHIKWLWLKQRTTYCNCVVV